MLVHFTFNMNNDINAPLTFIMYTMWYNGRNNAGDFSIFIWQEYLETQTDHVKIYTVDFVQVFEATCNANFTFLEM